MASLLNRATVSPVNCKWRTVPETAFFGNLPTALSATLTRVAVRRHLPPRAKASEDRSSSTQIVDPTRPPLIEESDDEEVSALMEGVTFSQLCDDFQCVSSPAVEQTARLLARDIHDIKEDKRSLSCFAVNVKFKDPLRSFQGRNLYRRPSWIWNGLERPQVTMRGMEMLSTSVLVIKWRLRGTFRNMPGSGIAGEGLNLLVTSTFTFNQISGQVTEHRDEWDLSSTPLPLVPLFFSSRLAWNAIQAGKDLQESAGKLGSAGDKAADRDGSGNFVFPDPSGDPRKFFVQDDPNKELYQFAFAVALMYLLVQFLQQVL